jgi:Prolyl oligopeptidase family
MRITIRSGTEKSPHLSCRCDSRAAPRRQGENDPRVTMSNADAMAAALRKAKRDVTYVVYPDDGHGFARPENQLDSMVSLRSSSPNTSAARAEPWKKIAGSTEELGRERPPGAPGPTARPSVPTRANRPPLISLLSARQPTCRSFRG